MADPRYVAKSVSGGWWCVFDATTGLEVAPDGGDPFMEKRDATTMAARLSETDKNVSWLAYVRHRKLTVHNEQHRRPGSDEFARINREKAERLAAAYPDFPATFDRMEAR